MTAAALALLQTSAPAHAFHPSVAGSAPKQMGKSVVVERPTVVLKSHSGGDGGRFGGGERRNETEVEGQLGRQEALEANSDVDRIAVVGGEGHVEKDEVADTDEAYSLESEQDGYGSADEASMHVSAEDLSEPGEVSGEALEEAGAHDVTDSSQLDEEAHKANELLYREPADFRTFTENTSLNYFHLHKTGGVSFKERLFDFFMLYEKLNRSGRRAKVVDTCHMSGSARPALGIEAKWSCDWGEIETMPEEERNKIDVVLGHQYWERGAGYWIPNRDLRHFTVMRHPLHRKVSFFYHFFVRNTGRSEESVSENELIQFVLGKEMSSSPLTRDAGPGYYASRLWSDGVRGYGEKNNFIIPQDKAGAMVFNSIRRLRRNFVFIGLQTQERASLCMLQKTVEAFSKAHGFNNFFGLEDISKQRERLNTGSYPLSGTILWSKMTEDQKNEFKRVERVDLAIYKESVKMFREMVKKFDCLEFVVDSEEDEIAM